MGSCQSCNSCQGEERMETTLAEMEKHGKFNTHNEEQTYKAIDLEQYEDEIELNYEESSDQEIPELANLKSPFEQK